MRARKPGCGVRDEMAGYLERRILTSFLRSRGIDPGILERFYGEEFDVPDDDVLFFCEKPTIWDVLEQFERTFDERQKKFRGVALTPRFVVDYINERVILENEKEVPSIIDPACGSGVFLIDALFKLKEKTGKSYRDLVEGYIWGIDIDPRAVRRAKIMLSLVVFEHEGEFPRVLNIFTGNSLDRGFLSESLGRRRFSAVVGNPPYVRIQNLNEELREIVKRWSFSRGDTDMFIPFFELGIELLEDGGKVGYITPNSYFTSKAGRELRRFLQKGKLIEEIVDFDHHQIFDGLTTYTAITIVSKRRRKYFIFKKIEDASQITNLRKVRGRKINFGELDFTKWNLSKDRRIVRVMERAPYKLKDVADIRVGIATLADRVFIIDETIEDKGYFVKRFDGVDFLIEKEITKEIIKASIIKSEDDIRRNKRRIIFPYKKAEGRYVLLLEDELRNMYPKTYDYLLSCRDVLMRRDRGKRSYDSWFAFGRSQGINSTFGKKILTPPMAPSPTFVICDKEDATFYSGYGIFPKREPFTDLLVLKKILNSGVVRRYIENTSRSYRGGWKSYSKIFLADIGLPEMDEEHIRYLREESDQRLVDEFLEELYDRTQARRFLIVELRTPS